MATAIANAYYAQTGDIMCLAHKQATLFDNNPAAKCFPEYAVQNLNKQIIRQVEEKGDQLISISYLVFEATGGNNSVRSNPRQNMLCRMAERVGLSGKFTALPRIYLTREEQCFGKFFETHQIAVVSQGIEKYKTWDKARMEEVIRAFPDYNFIQLGASGDVPLSGAKYLCGKLSLRQVAATLYNSRCLIGPQGALIHLARAVDCPAIILGPSAEPYSIMAYPEFRTVSPENPCPYCTEGKMFFSNCEYPEKCMEGISSKSVIDALKDELSHERKTPAPSIYDLSPEPAYDLLDYYRQYCNKTGTLNTIFLTQIPTGEKHASFRSLTINANGICHDLIQFNRECRFSSLVVDVSGTHVLLPYGATLWMKDKIVCQFAPDDFQLHGCFKISSGGETWYLPRKKLIKLCFSKALDLKDGNKLLLQLRTKDISSIIEASLKSDMKLKLKVKLATLLAKLSRFYDNRWIRKLWNAGY